MAMSDQNVDARTVVLLGAGASRDAGLPLTEELAQVLVRNFDEELSGLERRHLPMQEPIVRALHVVYGAMVAHATEHGKSPLSAVNVERLVSAVRLLRDRATHEAAPFVATWKKAIEEVDSHPISVSDSDLAKHFMFDSNLRLQTSGLRDQISRIARDITATGNGETFRILEQQLLRKVCHVLAAPKRVDYLLPLAELALSQPGGLDVATLNYDTTVEMIAVKAGVSLDTGMGRWRPGGPIEFQSKDRHINLIKLHGSVSWSRSTGGRERPPGHPFVQHAYLDGSDPLTNDNPVIVIGDREKLTAEGPTLALMRAFEEAMARADRLVVVGYSFGDDHINTVMRNWLGADDSRTITILDPSWPAPERMVGGADTVLNFRDTLRFVAGYSLPVIDGRVLVIKDTASRGLRRALTATPLQKVAAEVSVVACLDEQPFLQVTNHGYELDLVAVSALPMSNDPKSQSVVDLRLSVDEPGSPSVRLTDFAHGQTVRIFFNVLPESSGFGSIWISGANWRANLSEHVTIALNDKNLT
jgi:hypothetical protein